MKIQSKAQTLLPWVAVFSLFSIPLSAQTGFDSGSDGSFGPINITVDTTMDLPPDGIFHATTVNIASGVSLFFNRNELNTPVFLLATGLVNIEGHIQVNGSQGSFIAGGLGGPGGFDGGSPGGTGIDSGDGYGPGGGLGGIANAADPASVGSGSFGSVSPFNGPSRNGISYGSPLLIPMIGGSGGGGAAGEPGFGGGGGGGALLIASNTEIFVSGSLRSLGGQAGTNSSWFNGGSGGAIRLIAPKVSGGGDVFSESRNASNFRKDDQFGGYGRIRIDTFDRSDMSFTFDPVSLTTIGANMVVFPALPSLDIIAAAGTNIPEGSGSAVSIVLPFGTDPNQTVTVQARDYDGVVPIAVVVQPENGARTVVEDSIDNLAANPASKVINVVLPVNVPVKIFAWTRE